MPSDQKKASLRYSILILLIVVTMISIGMLVFHASIQLMLFMTILTMIPFVMRLGYTYETLEKKIFSSMLSALQPALILLAVGMLIGSWMASGTVPALIYYGIQAISPQFFLLTTLIFCSIVSLATGSSWATLGTAGIAMMGVSQSLGIPAGVTAGAIISGAYFGDKMSPLSDSTNLSAAVVGADLMTHIKHMLWTTVPAYTITAIIFTVMGFKYGNQTVNSAEVSTLTGYLGEHFHLGAIPFIPIVILFLLLISKKPAITSIFIGSLAGALVAIFYQGVDVREILNILYNGFYVESGIEVVDTLLQRGGLISMVELVILFLFALGLGGLLQTSGVLETIVQSITSKIKSKGMLVFVTILTAYFTLGMGGAFSFSAVMTGTLMKPLFEKFNLCPENLSRIIEDTATQSCALPPWTASGLFTAAALGVSPLVYIPFCFLAMITPLFSLAYGIIDFTIKEKPEKVSGSYALEV
ncbi:Na+/H+ antiporter NhaC [Bacillus sp. FJAT-50079]|uniref:Na+/H+ antiporter NhaC n=1 Tax=Bacillus sp. FJAT-50079 TaxID=2833577 RepID=UPI001BC9324A|nr:Na+/H+ antiporter NhaC [Bacillus sp. FJAT-50079]MBS4208037.1 Na+/H+ antiporter NhaC [Bacillus sp. FJAT-50079]